MVGAVLARIPGLTGHLNFITAISWVYAVVVEKELPWTGLKIYFWQKGIYSWRLFSLPRQTNGIWLS